MTNKQRKTMIEQWVTQMNPKAILRAADARCGARYAVYVVSSPGEFGTRCTDYLPLEQLTQPDLLIDIQMSRYSGMDYDKADRLIAIGRSATRQALGRN